MWKNSPSRRTDINLDNCRARGEILELIQTSLVQRDSVTWPANTSLGKGWSTFEFCSWLLKCAAFQNWTSLAVQWLRLHLPMQGVWVQSLVGIPKIPHAPPPKSQNINNRSNTFNNTFHKVTHLIKALKMAYVKKKNLKKTGCDPLVGHESNLEVATSILKMCSQCLSVVLKFNNFRSTNAPNISQNDIWKVIYI